MRSVLIIEPQIEGHHGVYLCWLIKEALKRDYQIHLATLSYCVQHPIMETICQEAKSSLQVVTVPDPPFTVGNHGKLLSLVQREFYYHKLFGMLFQKAREKGLFDHVLVAYMDICSNAMALLGSPFGTVPWSGIIMRPAFHYKGMGVKGPGSLLTSAKKLLFFHLLRNQYLDTLFSIDPILLQFVSEKKPAFSKHLRFLPGPISFEGDIARHEARNELKIPANAVLVLIYGAVSFRKGFDFLLAATQCLDFPEEVHILIAGVQDQDSSQFLKESQAAQKLMHSGRLHLLNAFLNNKNETMVFAAADIVWLGYRQHYGMSGVLIQAGKLKLPVIACEEGLLGWLTKKHQLGLAIKVSDQKAVAEAVRFLVQNKGASKTFGENGQLFSSEHTPEHFGSIVWRMPGPSI